MHRRAAPGFGRGGLRRVRLPGRTLTAAVLLGAASLPGGRANDVPPLREEPMAAVMRLAVENNVDVLLAALQAERSGYQTDQARGRLLPQISLTGDYQRIDEDRSETAGENLAEERTAVGATLRQMIFDDAQISLFRAARHDEERLRLEKEAVRLLIAATAARQYLDYQESIAREQVERENLDRTRRILEFSQARSEAGSGTAGEVYRWQAQAANQEGRVHLAVAWKRQARSTLNQTLGRDPTARWLPEPSGDEESVFYRFGQKAVEAGGNASMEARLYHAVLTSARRRSPTLQALDQAIAGQRILLAQTERRRYLPRLEARFGYTYLLDEEYAGTSLAETVAALGLPTDQIPTRDDEEWTAQIAAIFPFYEGGGKYASIRRERVATEELLHALRRAEEITSRDTVNALHRIRGSRPRLGSAREASEFARLSLELVDQRYRAGAALMVELIDAQHTVFAADSEAVIALYTYLRDLVELQRAVSFFEALEPPGQLRAWIRELAATPESGKPGPDFGAQEPVDPPE